MNLLKTVLILDLDGVLITTPSWKADEIDFDGYSKFSSECVKNLNLLLDEGNFEIWLSSTRRAVTSLQEFNTIFCNRGINEEITGFLPENYNRLDRKTEIVEFLEEKSIKNYLVIDDDKSLNSLTSRMKEKIVLTDYSKGLNVEKCLEAIQKLKQKSSKHYL